MHPSHEHMRRMVEDPEALFARRLEVARQSGVPEEPLRRYAAERGPQASRASRRPIEPDRELLDGRRDRRPTSASGSRYETPGHAPSHVCLFQPERRLLISGDHLLGRISLYFDYGYSPDPVGEFLDSLDVVERLGARLCLAGHGRTFADVHAHIHGNRALVHERLRPGAAGGAATSELTAFELVAARVRRGARRRRTRHWLLSETLCYLTPPARPQPARRAAPIAGRARALAAAA